MDFIFSFQPSTVCTRHHVSEVSYHTKHSVEKISLVFANYSMSRITRFFLSLFHDFSFLLYCSVQNVCSTGSVSYTTAQLRKREYLCDHQKFLEAFYLFQLLKVIFKSSTVFTEEKLSQSDIYLL